MDGVFYMPDETSDNRITRLAACVVAPELDAPRLLATLREHIAPVFLPRPLLFVDVLPRNDTGKLSRAALQALFQTPGFKTPKSKTPSFKTSSLKTSSIAKST